MNDRDDRPTTSADADFGIRPHSTPDPAEARERFDRALGVTREGTTNGATPPLHLDGAQPPGRAHGGSPPPKGPQDRRRKGSGPSAEDDEASDILFQGSHHLEPIRRPGVPSSRRRRQAGYLRDAQGMIAVPREEPKPVVEVIYRGPAYRRPHGGRRHPGSPVLNLR